MATHWIDTATINGFRGLRNLRLEGLGNLNIFVGSNNTGKTSILEALSILANYKDPSEWLSMVARRDFGRLDETRAQSIRWCFNRSVDDNGEIDRFENKCLFSCSGRLGVGQLSVTCKNVVVRNKRTIETEEAVASADEPEFLRGVLLRHTLDFKQDPSLFGPEELEPTDFVIWEDELKKINRKVQLRREKTLPADTLNPYSYQINRLQVSRLSQSRLQDHSRSLLSLLREFDSDINGIDVISLRGDRPSIYIEHKRLGSAPLSVFGDALRRIVLLATTLLGFKNGGVLFLDEIETGIHISSIQKVFHWLSKTASELGVQIFATTHSLEAVDAIVFDGPEVNRDAIVFRVEQTAGNTQAKRFEGESLARIRRERGLDLR